MSDGPPSAMAVRTCGLRACGVACATPESLPGLRKQPGPSPGRALARSSLNHADDQTVVAVSAVLQAIHEFGMQGEDFSDWGVVGSPRFAGRVFCANALDKFGRLGPLGVSPLIIPYLTLHAVSSMISLVLGIHGPALGAGGGEDGLVQALLAGLTLQQEQDLPGVWVVITGWDPEPFSLAATGAASQPVCQAAALALHPVAAGALPFPSLRLFSWTAPVEVDGPGLREFIQVLSAASGNAKALALSWKLPGNHTLELVAADPRVGVVPQAKSA